MSRAEVVERDDGGNAERVEASSGVQLCLEEGPSFVYEERGPPDPGVKEVSSKRRKLWSSMISDRK